MAALDGMKKRNSVSHIWNSACLVHWTWTDVCVLAITWLSFFLHVLVRMVPRGICRCSNTHTIMLEPNRGPRWNQKTQLAIVRLEFRLSRFQSNLPPQGEPGGIDARRELRFFYSYFGPLPEFPPRASPLILWKAEFQLYETELRFFIPSRAAIF